MRRRRTGAIILLLAPWLAAAAGVAADGGTDTADALVAADGVELVSAHCGACHSLRLVTQNRGDAGHWRKLIRWMQAEHNLWDLGEAEADIIAYLAEHYGAPAVSPRRAPLETRWRDAPE